MWGTVRHHQLHHNNTHRHLYLVYFIHLTARTSCNYIPQTNTMHFRFGHISATSGQNLLKIVSNAGELQCLS
jgi:hypothetical protein